MSWKEILSLMTGILVIIAALVVGIHYTNLSDARAEKQEDQLFVRANTICGTPPLRIIPHNSSWSHGGWIEVRCKDGSTRAIR